MLAHEDGRGGRGEKGLAVLALQLWDARRTDGAEAVLRSPRGRAPYGWERIPGGHLSGLSSG